MHSYLTAYQLCSKSSKKHRTHKLLNKNKTNQYLTIGKIGKTYGVKGWVKIHSFTQPEANIVNYSPQFVSFGGKLLPLSECKKQGTFLIGLIENINTPEEAKKLANAEILISENQLPDLHSDKTQEYYWTDLIGLDVFNLDKTYLGKIDSLFETGANDVLVIINDHKKTLIPYVLDKYIKSIDLNQKQMIVDWYEAWL